MRTQKRILIGGGMASLLLIGAIVGTLTFGSVFAATPQSGNSGQDAATMNGAEAEAIALAAYPGATVLETDYDDEDGAWSFTVELDNGLEVTVDPATGSIIGTQPANSDDEQVDESSDEEAVDNDAVEEEVIDEGTDADEANAQEDDEEVVSSGAASLTKSDAEAIALEANPGTTVVETDLDNEHGVLSFSVELDNGIDVQVDATTGAILASAADDDNVDDENED